MIENRCRSSAQSRCRSKVTAASSQGTFPIGKAKGRQKDHPRPPISFPIGNEKRKCIKWENVGRVDVR